MKITSFPPNLKAPRVPFAIGGYTVALSKERGDVFDKNALVASFVVDQRGAGTHVETQTAYRRKGVAAELIYQVLKLAGPEVSAQVFSDAAMAKRNPEGQALYRKVQARG